MHSPDLAAADVQSLLALSRTEWKIIWSPYPGTPVEPPATKTP